MEARFRPRANRVLNRLLRCELRRIHVAVAEGAIQRREELQREAEPRPRPAPSAKLRKRSTWRNAGSEPGGTVYIDRALAAGDPNWARVKLIDKPSDQFKAHMAGPKDRFMACGLRR
jgi:hypothetical protein